MNHDIRQEYYIECIKRDLSAKVGRPISTYSDFNYLYLQMKKKVSDPPSVSTLKRMWAYVSDSSSRSKSTLNSLARYLEYSDWEEYVESIGGNDSGYFDNVVMMVSEYVPGTLVELKWNPDRVLVVEYVGDNMFRVVTSKNAKLHEKSVFHSSWFSIGLPMICTDVKLEGGSLGNYVAGYRSGLTSIKVIPPNEND